MLPSGRSGSRHAQNADCDRRAEQIFRDCRLGRSIGPAGKARHRAHVVRGALALAAANQAPAVVFSWTPASVITDASSPDWNISRTISHPPRNSPLTYSWGMVGQLAYSFTP